MTTVEFASRCVCVCVRVQGTDEKVDEYTYAAWKRFTFILV